MFGKHWFLLDDDRRRIQWARENGGKGKVIFLTENEVVSFLAFFTNSGGKKKMS